VLTGRHTVHVKYANIALKGSPFSVDVFDPSAVVVVGQMSPIGRIGKPFSFQGKIDSSANSLMMTVSSPF
jgi:hypothetical protein